MSVLAVAQPWEGFGCDGSIGAAVGAPTCALSPWLLRNNLLVAGQSHGWTNDQVLAAGSRSKLEPCFSVLGCASICSVAAGKAAPCFPAHCPRASLTPLKKALAPAAAVLSVPSHREALFFKSWSGTAGATEITYCHQPDAKGELVVRRPEVRDICQQL